VDVVFEVRSSAEKMCTPLSFSAVGDHNRITRHLLEVVYSHLTHTRPLPVGAGGGGGGGGSGSGASPSGGYGGGGGAGSAAPGGSALGVGGDGGRGGDLAQDHATVWNIYKDPVDEENGTSLQEAIAKGKQLGLSEKAVRDATITLQMDGHVYSTVDENHFKAT
jgi:hypothetical protein